jgi:hypothetical protein
MEVRWELISAPRIEFDSPDEARSVIEYFRRRATGQSGQRPAQRAIDHVTSRTFEWMSPVGLEPQVVRQALTDLPVGEVSRVLVDEIGFHLVRVLERRCAQ